MTPWLFWVLACHTPEQPVETLLDGPLQPLSEAPYTTLQTTWAPLEPSEQTRNDMESGALKVTDLDQFTAAGLGVVRADGAPWIERNDLAPSFSPAIGSERHSLLYLWQAADPQVIDEESPIRFEAWESIYRPGGHLTAQTWEAHVATARRISEASDRPFDFAIIAGDLTDGGQSNELAWFLTSLNGGVVNPDSGVDDDPVPGPGNDYNDPFRALGLGRPWYAAMGNHETLYNGGFGNVDEDLRSWATGSEVYDSPGFPNGFRDGSTLTAEVRTQGPTPPDVYRTVLYRSEFLGVLHDAPGQPAGHGLTPADVAEERGYFSVHPVAGKPIRLVVLDTVHTYGQTGLASFGFIGEEQRDWLVSTLAEADASHELVLVMSHHRLQDLSPDSPVDEDEVAAILAASEGVFLLVTGHGHSNTKHLFPRDWDGVDPTLGFWELMLASTLDFPMQSRILEVVDEGNDTLSIYATNLGHNSPPGSLPHQAREMAAAKTAFPGLLEPGDPTGNWTSNLSSMNLLLRVQIPSAVGSELRRHEWPSLIESEVTLSEFSTPE